MDQLLDIGTQELYAGVTPDLDEITTPLWKDARNVIPRDGGLVPYLGMKIIHDFAYPRIVTGLNQAFVDGERRIYAMTYTEAFILRLPPGVDKIETTSSEIIADNMESAVWNSEIWGKWLILNSGLGKPKVWRNAGPIVADEDDLAVPFKWCKVLKKLGPHLLAFNTSERGKDTDPSGVVGGHNWVEWCSADNIMDWEVNPENTAGNLVLRDLDAPIMAVCSLGEDLAIYSTAAMSRLRYVGTTFVFGSKEVLQGVGAWGPRAVCEVNGKNYGFGPQGIFVTDGFQVEYIADNKVIHFLQSKIDHKKAYSWAFAWFNHETDLVEFRFIGKDKQWYGMLYDARTNQFWITDLPLFYAIERSVWPEPIGALDNAVSIMNTGTRWGVTQISGYIQSKPLGGTARGRYKQVEMLELLGKLNGLQLKVWMIHDDPRSEGTLIMDVPAQHRNWINFESDYAKFELSFTSADGQFKVTGIPVWGKVQGYLG